MAETTHALGLALLLVVAIITLGTLGYEVLEGWNLLDSFYMTVITLGSVGYSEVHPLSDEGRIFTTFLIFFGVGVGAYCFTLIAQLVVEGELGKLRRFYRMHRKISTFRNHTILCGYGRLARFIVPELLEAKHDVVVIENSPVEIIDLDVREIPHIEGNAYDDETLHAAGIVHAKSLLAFLPSDADNVYITLCARELNPGLKIIARAENETGEKKMRRAGADQVLSPYRLSASRIAQQLIRPNVSDFLELAGELHSGKLIVEEISVPPGSPLNGKTLEESELRSKADVIIAAIIDHSGNMNFNPGRESVITSGATMIVLGQSGSMEKLGTLLSGAQ